MTPLPKRENTTSILVERVEAPAADADGAPGSDVHVAGGDHRGIVVNKNRRTGERRTTDRWWLRPRRGRGRDGQMLLRAV